MEAIFFLIPLSMLIVFGALIAFVWSVRNGQYEDMDKEAWRILQDDDDNNTTAGEGRHTPGPRE